MTIIRDYTEEDKDRVFQILKDSLQQYGLSTDTASIDSDILAINTFYIAPGGAFKILELKDLSIGTYGLYKLDDKTCELRKMYLDPAYKGNGYGRILLEDAVKTAKNLGFSKITLETNSCLFEAVRMYRKYGFKEIDSEHFSCRCDMAMEMEI